MKSVWASPVLAGCADGGEGVLAGERETRGVGRQDAAGAEYLGEGVGVWGGVLPLRPSWTRAGVAHRARRDIGAGEEGSPGLVAVGPCGPQPLDTSRPPRSAPTATSADWRRKHRRHEPTPAASRIEKGRGGVPSDPSRNPRATVRAQVPEEV